MKKPETNNKHLVNFSGISSELHGIGNFYRKNKLFFEIFGFVAILTALFLQIPKDDSSLKYIQVMFLLILEIMTFVLIIWMWLKAFMLRKNREFSTAFSLIYSGIATVFLTHLFKFTYTQYQEQLFFYFKYTIIGSILLLFIAFSKFFNYMGEQTGRKKFWRISYEVATNILAYSIVSLTLKSIVAPIDISFQLIFIGIPLLVLSSVNSILCRVFNLYPEKLNLMITLILIGLCGFIGRMIS